MVCPPQPARITARITAGNLLYGTSSVSYVLDGRQQILVPAGRTLTTFALRDVSC